MIRIYRATLYDSKRPVFVVRHRSAMNFAAFTFFCGGMTGAAIFSIITKVLQ